MKQVRDALKVPTVLVLPRDETIRKHVAHMPNNIKFPKEGPAKWPLDTFTQRRIRDGDVTVVVDAPLRAIAAAPEPRQKQRPRPPHPRAKAPRLDELTSGELARGTDSPLRGLPVNPLRHTMTRGLIFWVLMLIWFVFQIALFVAPAMVGHYGGAGSTLLDFILFLYWAGRFMGHQYVADEPGFPQ